MLHPIWVLMTLSILLKLMWRRTLSTYTVYVWHVLGWILTLQCVTWLYICTCIMFWSMFLFSVWLQFRKIKRMPFSFMQSLISGLKLNGVSICHHKTASDPLMFQHFLIFRWLSGNVLSLFLELFVLSWANCLCCMYFCLLWRKNCLLC